MIRLPQIQSSCFESLFNVRSLSWSDSSFRDEVVNCVSHNSILHFSFHLFLTLIPTEVTIFGSCATPGRQPFFVVLNQT